jgi:ribosomal protein S18 acetylase RimI-like enzyme
MRIRKLAPPDRDGIAGLLRSDDTFSEEEVAVALELIDAAIAHPGGDYLVKVCQGDDGSVAGYICYGRTPMTDGTFDLYWVATHVLARGRGVASRLVAAMEGDLLTSGVRTIRVETSQLEAYGAARTFYTRRGYTEVGRIADFYKPGDDLITLTKRLDLQASDAQPARAMRG